jgi:squalene-hopene/tetraprenyl-beta-curcumene cyclase
MGNDRLIAMLVLATTGMAYSAGVLDGNARREAAAAVTRGNAFLLSRQGANGAWLEHPAITSLACTALLGNPSSTPAAWRQAVDRGLAFVRGHAQEDGSIWNHQTEQYPNYSTAVSLVALATRNAPEDQAIIRKAREFLLGSQFADAAGDGASFGGIGYGKQLRPDLSNSQWALEALRLTDHLDREPFTNDPERARRADLAWERAVEFLSKCQNLVESNDQGWVVSDADNRGGFVYMPGESKAGEVEDGAADGKGLRSYGSMTYAGFKSMIYAKLQRDDPRVQAAWDWISRHVTFTENPGMGLSGYYYYLYTGAKALAAYGAPVIVDPHGVRHCWRTELAAELVRRQHEDGRWVNEDGRWFESMPELVTAYAVLTLEVALGNEEKSR